MLKPLFKNRTIIVTISLVAIILLVLAASAAGSWQIMGMINSKAEAAIDAKQQTAQSEKDVQSAQRLRSYLDTHKDDISRAGEVVADTKFYQYQNQIIIDINASASQAGVTILGFDFPQAAQTSTKDTSDLKSIQATVTLKNPVAYNDFIKFLKLIEQNLTKMQITDITVNPDEKTSGLINTPKIGIQVYIK